MNDLRRSGAESLPIDSDSETARWVRGLSRGRPARIEALATGGHPESLFIANELLVDGSDSDVIEELVQRHGAEVVPRNVLPPPAEGIESTSPASVASMPLPVKLRIANPPAPSRRALDILRSAFSPTVTATSDSAVRLAGFAAELAIDDKQVGLNFVSTASTLPLLSPKEWNPVDPFSTAAYIGSGRVAHAWQLVEAYREFRSTKPVTIGILDSGFWLNGFVPGVANGQTVSDLGSSVQQLNLLDEGVAAGGASGIPTKDGFTSPWHGNGSASVATATVGNNSGASGVGGTVAAPILFKTDGSLEYYFRCLYACLAWGVDVLNMSIEFSTSEFWFPASIWDRNFQYASDAGLIMVAAAGNSGSRLPEDGNPRPATRTPGTITVGALDVSNAPQSYSNRGSSINVWAPTDIPVIPDENSPFGRLFTGTSASAPFVSGVLGMMRAVAPVGTLTAPRAKRLLEESGWRGTGEVGIGVDAYAAVLSSMGGRLPDDAAAAHSTPQSARTLTAGPGGLLMPHRLPSDPRRDALASGSDSNWYRFDVPLFSLFSLQVRSYALLGAVSVTLEPDDDASRAPSEVVDRRTPGLTQISGVLSPGGYKLHVRGSLNLYELTVELVPTPLVPDRFEPNDGFDFSTHIRLLEPGDNRFFPGRALPAGVYDLNIHTPSDRDVFRIEPVAMQPLSIPTAHVSLSDMPIDVALFDSSHNEISREVGVRTLSLKLPRSETTFLAVSAAQATRYRLEIRLEIDSAQLPGPFQDHVVVPLPDLGDPPFRVDNDVIHVRFQVSSTSSAQALNFATTEGQSIRVELLDGNGFVERTSRWIMNSSRESAHLDIGGLEEGAHMLRVQRTDAQSSLNGTPLNVQVLPSFG